MTDSVQLGDRGILSGTLESFGNLNEPHFADYLQVDLGEEFRRVGLKPQLKCLQNVTKSVSAVKPLE